MTPETLSYQHVSADSVSSVFGASESCRWAGMPAPHRRFYPALRGCPVSLDQPLVRETFSARVVDETIQPLEGVPLYIAIVQAEGELIDVALQVLRAGVMVDAMQPALQDGPYALNAVGRDWPAREFASPVVYCVMVEEQSTEIVVRSVLIGVDLGADFNRAMDFVLDSAKGRVRYDHGHSLTTTRAQAKDGGLTYGATARVELFPLVLIALFSADERLVNLDGALELCQLRTTCLAQASQNEPRGFLGDADLFGQLKRRDALAGRNEQIHGIDPLVQRDMRTLKNRARTNGEIELAGVAAMEAVFARGEPIPRVASRTDRAVGPEPIFQIRARGFFVRDKLEKLKRADCAFAHWGSIG